jgi:cleavage stimulation factor subunit 3
MYPGTDAIADRDLGFALARKATPANPLGKSETQQSLSSTGTPQGTNRVASPDYRNKREDNRGGGGSGSGGECNQGNKRMRPSSPPRGADIDRETRWEGPSSRRRPFSPPPTSTNICYVYFDTLYRMIRVINWLQISECLSDDSSALSTIIYQAL